LNYLKKKKMSSMLFDFEAFEEMILYFALFAFFGEAYKEEKQFWKNLLSHFQYVSTEEIVEKMKKDGPQNQFLKFEESMINLILLKQTLGIHY
jgi:hypothetical protein